MSRRKPTVEEKKTDRQFPVLNDRQFEALDEDARRERWLERLRRSFYPPPVADPPETPPPTVQKPKPVVEEPLTESQQFIRAYVRAKADAKKANRKQQRAEAEARRKARDHLWGSECRAKRDKERRELLAQSSQAA